MKTISVFGASGRQGQSQVKQLLQCGYRTRAISRSLGIFQGSVFAGVEVTPADYSDARTLELACKGADAIFFQPPQAERPDRVLEFAGNVAAAAKNSGVGRIVHNSTMWAPDAPCGQPMYDLVLAIEDIIASAGIPYVILRPTVFMDNWLTAFAKPALVKERKYRYPHKPDLRYSPISLDDLAQFMVTALDRDDWTGKRIRVAGPQTLTPPEVATILSEAFGVKITYEYQSPQDFGYFVYDLVGAGTGLDRDTYASYFSSFYTFNNDAPQQPFLYDVAPLLIDSPLKLETFSQWAARQDWQTLDEAVGSSSR